MPAYGYVYIYIYIYIVLEAYPEMAPKQLTPLAKSADHVKSLHLSSAMPCLRDISPYGTNVASLV